MPVLLADFSGTDRGSRAAPLEQLAGKASLGLETETEYQKMSIYTIFREIYVLPYEYFIVSRGRKAFFLERTPYVIEAVKDEHRF